MSSSDSNLYIYKFNCIKNILEGVRGQEKFELENLNPSHQDRSYYNISYGNFRETITVYYNKGTKHFPEGFVFSESLQKLYNNLAKIKSLKDEITNECRE